MPIVATTIREGGVHCRLCGWKLLGYDVDELQKEIVAHLEFSHQLITRMIVPNEKTRPRFSVPGSKEWGLKGYGMAIIEYAYPRVVSEENFRHRR